MTSRKDAKSFPINKKDRPDNIRISVSVSEKIDFYERLLQEKLKTRQITTDPDKLRRLDDTIARFRRIINDFKSR